ncbi:hypothetical protein L1987_21469 [Smallanthus sonchifolius]|uniref:Uncharacterized protein n=1 Tax=Smallanthus sonchifolius TaxID=185202 RepID=A0ACB9IUR3_9ASTR|nr:hypothetical protein L1987_21469 [Smallanthus sonchifolius]
METGASTVVGFKEAIANYETLFENLKEQATVLEARHTDDAAIMERMHEEHCVQFNNLKKEVLLLQEECAWVKRDVVKARMRMWMLVGKLLLDCDVVMKGMPFFSFKSASFNNPVLSAFPSRLVSFLLPEMFSSKVFIHLTASRPTGIQSISVFFSLGYFFLTLSATIGIPSHLSPDFPVSPLS